MDKYDCHINVEICCTVSAVKYLYKYIHKGVDRLSVTLDREEEVIDEIKDYLDCRYISPVEACWRIFAFSLHGNSHTIERLPIHVENGQPVIFSSTATREQLQNTIDNIKDSKLLAYFKKCEEDADARQYLYHEFPEHYV